MEYEFIAGNLALDFANTVHSYGSADPRDDLKSLQDLMDWARQAGLLRPHERLESSHGRRAQFFRDMVELRAELYLLFASLAMRGQASPEALGRFNHSVRQAMADGLVQRRGTTYAIGWEHLHPARRMHHYLVHAALDLLTSPLVERIRQCDGGDCSWLFVDTSRNRTRRWCDMRACGNRAKVRRFRGRAGKER